MEKFKKFINKLSKSQKFTALFILLLIVFVASVVIPTFSRYEKRVSLQDAPIWDGVVATSYQKGTGTSSDPYIISRGSELAYFQSQLSTYDYDGKYFELVNDIKINEGIFSYDDTDGIEYTLDTTTYYVNKTNGKYYDNTTYTGTEEGTLNVLGKLDGFKGYFKGNYNTVYGIYIVDETNEEVALFTDLEGDLEDLYIQNTIIYGGTITGGIASKATGSAFKNVLFDGYVLGDDSPASESITETPTASVINFHNTVTIDDIDMTNSTPFIGGDIISTSITGNYTIEGDNGATTIVKIDDNTVTGGSFNVSLGTTIMDEVEVSTYIDPDESATLTFSSLSYNITYKYAVAGGIVAISDDVTIENCINKGTIYGYSIAGGLVGVTSDALDIDQSYNNEDIDSDSVTGGLIGVIEKSSSNVTVDKSYNAKDMTGTDIGGLIGYISDNTGSVTLTDVFNTSTTDYSIGTISGTTVTLSSAYYVTGTSAVESGTTTGSFTQTTESNLQSETYLTTNLSFDEFENHTDLGTNSDHVWVFETDSEPILFIDDMNNPLANIIVSSYAWNNLSHELSTLRFNTSITITVEDADSMNPMKEKYYYISNSSTPLTDTQISQISTWTTYSSSIQKTTEDFYVIYAKIVDYDDNVTYINSDLLILGLDDPLIDLTLDDDSWDDLRSTLGNVYIDQDKTLTIDENTSTIDIETKKYYITDSILTSTQLDDLSYSSWTAYVDGIDVDTKGTYVVYAQIEDEFGFITYFNSDYIIYDGYTQDDLIIGRDSANYPGADNYITNKSTATVNSTYLNTSATELTNHTHNLMSTILLPLGSKITLIDNINDKVYYYKITTASDIYNYADSCDAGDTECVNKATYPFTLFKEIGRGATDNSYTESTYYTTGTVSEDFTIILDLSSVTSTTNYDDVLLFIELHDSTSKNVRPSLYEDIKDFNIYATVSSNSTEAELTLTTTYSGGNINFNSNTSTDINITSGISYKTKDTFDITDTTYEDKQIGLAIKFEDASGVKIDRDYLKNVVFKIGAIEYYPGGDDIVRINLDNDLTTTTKTLNISTSENNSDLEAGTYYFKISNYVSYDGEYYDELGDVELSIPVTVSDNNTNIEYGFDVIMDSDDRVIDKSETSVQVTFDILQNGALSSPDIRVSLYKKDQLTAYNQDYTIVDLASYVSDSLTTCSTNVYYVTTNPVQYNDTTKLYNNFELNLITANFENKGYKFVFTLYDGAKKIGEIEKRIIVR